MKKYIIFALITMFIITNVSARPLVHLNITKIKTEPTPLQTSEYGDVWIKVRHIGNTVAKDVMIEYIPKFPFSVDPGDTVKWDIGDIYPGEEYHIHTKFKVDENAVQGENYLEFNINTGDTILTKKLPVEIRTDDAVLSITNIEFPKKIGPGTSNNMILTLQNLADSHLKNININLDMSSTTLPLATLETTTKKTIKKLEPGEKTNISFLIAADEGVINGLYKLPITLDYENEVGTSFETSQLTGIIVGGMSQLEVDIERNDIKTFDQTGTLVLRIVNRNDGKARFVSLSVLDKEYYEIISTDKIYIGNMDADDFQTAEFRLYVNHNQSELNIPILLNYKDSEGISKNETHNVKIELYSNEDLKRFNVVSSDNSLLIILFIITIAIIGFIYWKKKK